MKKIAITYILLLFSCAFELHAQKTMIRPLEVGEKVPDVTISNILNYTAKKTRISEFKNKLLILAFWGVTCTDCIGSMPEMERLQKEFGDKIQILFITSDSKKKVDALLDKSAFVRNVHLPFVIGDTILYKLFPYRAAGLHVWIDSNGVVVQKVSKNSYTSNDIQNFLNGKRVVLYQRQDDISVDTNVPLWLEGGGRQLKHIKYHSYIAESIPVMKAGAYSTTIQDSTTKKRVGIRFLNALLGYLFEQAYSEDDKRVHQKVIWEVNDSTPYFRPVDKAKGMEWIKKYSYCYELQVPVEKSEDLYTFMQQDLERYFNVSGKIEKRKFKCWVLVRGSSFEELLHKGVGKNVSHIDEHEEQKRALKKDSINVHNSPINALLYMLKKYLPADVEYVDDATDYKQLISINIRGSYNYEELRKELQKNGLDLEEGYKELNCLVLRETGYKKLIKK